MSTHDIVSDVLSSKEGERKKEDGKMEISRHRSFWNVQS